MMMMRSRMSLNLRCSRRRRIARRAERPGDENAKSTGLRGTPRGLASKAARPDDQSPGLCHLTPRASEHRFAVALARRPDASVRDVQSTPSDRRSGRRAVAPLLLRSFRPSQAARTGAGEARRISQRRRSRLWGGSRRERWRPWARSSWRALYYLDDARRDARRRRARRATCGTSSDRCNAPREAHRLTRPNCTRTTYSSPPRRTRRLSRDFARPGDSATAPIPRRGTLFARQRLLVSPGRRRHLRMRANRASAHVCDEECRESGGHGRHVGDVLHQRQGVRSHAGRGRRGVRRASGTADAGDPTGERGWLGKCLKPGARPSERDMYYELWGGGGGSGGRLCDGE